MGAGCGPGTGASGRVGDSVVVVDDLGDDEVEPLLGEGRVDYRGEFAALRRDSYSGSVVLEPHYAPEGMTLADAARVCVEAAQGLLAASARDV